MTNLEKANKETLAVLNDTQWPFVDIDTLYDNNGNPLILYHEKKDETECFVYPVAGKRKFFIETQVNGNDEYTTTRPRIEVLSYSNDNIIDNYLKQYPHYFSAEEILIKFITNDLPKIANHNRDKILYIGHCTDIRQRSVGYRDLNHRLLEKIVESGLSIKYSVKIY